MSESSNMLFVTVYGDGDSSVAIFRENDVMSESSSMLFATVFGKADALGHLTTTNTATQTFAGAGSAVGFAVATAVAEGTTAAAPYTDATTDFSYGPTPVSVSFSTTSVATYGVGDFLSGYSLSGLASPSVHGLL
jgi:hypothetical protein